MKKLVPFVQEQFKRGDRWCWETIIEEVALARARILTADALIHAGVTIRTGRYAFVRNNHEWKSVCDHVINSDGAAREIVEEIDNALKCRDCSGTADRWLSHAEAASGQLGDNFRKHLDTLVSWRGYTWNAEGECSQELRDVRCVVYGLWRLGDSGNPIAPFPHYVGETMSTMCSRIERPRNKCHRDWWGNGKAIGVTLISTEPSERISIEKGLIDILAPFCNAKGNRLQNRWNEILNLA